MADTYTDGWLSPIINTTSATVSSGGAFDWLNGFIDSAGSTALKVYQTKSQIDALKTQTATQQTYENQQQTVGRTTVIPNVDNNYLLLGVVGIVGAMMFLKA